jgi:hypothetical protein
MTVAFRFAGAVMLKRIAPIQVLFLILWAVCEAVCQKSPSAELLEGLHFDGSDSSQVQRQEMHTWSALPDAPSSIGSPKRETFYAFANETGSSWTFGAVGVSAGAMRGTELGAFIVGPHPTLIAHFQAAFDQKESSDFFSRYWHQPLIKPDARSYTSASSGFMGRASYAASRIFLTRDDSGKTRLNTSYLFGLLTSVAGATARRPYWARSASGTFNNFGSTIGGDAGINVFHEFGPGIRQMVKGHAPKFVFRIAERITRSQP